jgi:chaperone BCS1
MILFEDIDCMKAGNRRDDLSESRERPYSAAGIEKSDVADCFGVTLSGLLNVLGGVHAPENVTYVMTTNKVEALDPALLRRGHRLPALFGGGF